jgi:hypothetical protein
MLQTKGEPLLPHPLHQPKLLDRVQFPEYNAFETPIHDDDRYLHFEFVTELTHRISTSSSRIHDNLSVPVWR